MHEDITAKPADVLPIHRVGDEITFKFEGNVRAIIEGFELIGGVLWFTAYTTVSFQIPAGKIIHVERRADEASGGDEGRAA